MFQENTCLFYAHVETAIVYYPDEEQPRATTPTTCYHVVGVRGFETQECAHLSNEHSTAFLKPLSVMRPAPPKTK